MTTKASAKIKRIMAQPSQYSLPKRLLRISISLFRQVVRRTDVSVHVSVNYSFYTDLATPFGRLVYHYGAPLEALTFQSLVNDGDFVLDIGANEGLYSLLAADKVGTSGLVASIEPNPETLIMLERNIKANNCSQVTCIPAAVADRASEARFMAHDERGHLFAHLAAPGEQGLVTLVDVTTVDAIVEAAGRPVHGLKIDVEGAELSVLAGATKSIREYSPWLMIEVEPLHLARYGASPEELDERLRDLGYETFFGISTVRPGGLEPLTRPSDATRFGVTNVLCRAVQPPPATAV